MFLDTNDAANLIAEEFGISVTSDELARLARLGFGPAYRKLDGRKRLYRADDLRAWAASRLGPVVPTRDMPMPTHSFRSQLQ